MSGGQKRGFRLDHVETWETPAPLGTVGTVYPTFGQYDGFRDTSKKGIYSPRSVLSVPVGCNYLDFHLHTETINGVTAPRVACPIWRNYMPYLYGAFAVRFRADHMPGYKIAFLLWPQSNVWNDGEIDWPEGDLVTGSRMSPASAIPGTYNSGQMQFAPPERVYAATDSTSWHNARIEWIPGRLSWFWDGVEVGTVSGVAVPTRPMRWTLQAETTLTSTPVDPNVSGHLQVAEMSSWLYVGP